MKKKYKKGVKKSTTATVSIGSKKTKTYEGLIQHPQKLKVKGGIYNCVEGSSFLQRNLANREMYLEHLRL